MASLYVVVLHHPVTNKHGTVVTTAPVGPDIHDIARSCATYGVERYFIATPIKRHREFVQRMVDHWTVGHGASYNPDRKAALDIVEVVEGFEEALTEVESSSGRRPLTVATTAREGRTSITFDSLRERLRTGEEPFLLVFGTGSGLVDEVLKRCDECLEPILGPTPYNHLPVRAAVAIILDRLQAVRYTSSD